MQEDHRPLIVCDESGRFLFLAYTDSKGYKSSLERGTLWAVHSESDRLLPTGNEGILQRIEDRGSYFYAEVSISSYHPGVTEEKNENLLPPPSVSLSVDKQLAILLEIIRERKARRPKESYTGQLFELGIEKIRKKLGEEAVELILARKREEAIVEAADLLYHLLVFLEAENIDFSLVLEELNHRI
ncbi:MAG: phosphoribosyl-ATP diphosphatase [Spirochaetes bacterium]|nr:phosphoribosyl-ATP diphosphatase [Spirochaetota bacterium]